MMERQPGHTRSMTNIDRQFGEPIHGKVMRNETLDRAIELELAEARFDGDFPATGGAEQTLIAGGGDRLARPRRKAGIIGNPPQERVRIEKHAHYT